MRLATLVSVLMGCVTIMAVFVLARRLFGMKAAALAAALSLCSAPFLFYSRTGNLDVPALCWTMLALVALERCWSDGLSLGRAIACGVFAALAVATKDQSYGLLLPPLLLLLVRAVRVPAPTLGQRLRLPLILVASGVVAFLVASGIIMRPDRFVRHLDYITNFRETFANVRNPTTLTLMREPTFGGRVQLLGDLLRASGAAVGWPVILLGVAGFALFWRSMTTVRWMFAAVVGLYLLVLVPIEHVQYRYALAPAILLAILASGAVARLEHRPLAFGALAVLLIGPALAGGAEVTHAMLTDARRPASEWLGARAAAGDTLGFFGRRHQLPYVPAGVHAEALDEGGEARPRLIEVNPRWVIVAPDYFADPSRERSIFLPPDVYDGLRDGSLGWKLVARFESRGLLGRPLPYLPYVNPVVQVYERRAGQLTARQPGSRNAGRQP